MNPTVRVGLAAQPGQHLYRLAKFAVTSHGSHYIKSRDTAPNSSDLHITHLKTPQILGGTAGIGPREFLPAN